VALEKKHKNSLLWIKLTRALVAMRWNA